MSRSACCVAAVTFFLVAAGICVFSLIFKLLAVDVVAVSQIAAAPQSWIGHPDAWQWDALAGLATAGALAAAYVMSACVRGRRLPASVAAAIWMVMEAALLGLVMRAS